MSLRPATCRAAPCVNADYSSAGRAGPAYSFLRKESSITSLLDALKVLDRAHMVSGTVPFIQQHQAIARDLVALKAELRAFSMSLAARLHLTLDAGDWLVGIVGPATGTDIASTQVCCAYCAVDAARGYKLDFVAWGQDRSTQGVWLI